MSDFYRLLEEQIPRLLPRRYARALTRNIERADDVSSILNYQPDRDVLLARRVRSGIPV